MTQRQVLAPLLLLLSVTAPLADTVELVDGSLLEGRYVGGNKSSIMFETVGEISALETSAVIAIYFSAGIEAAEARAAVPPPEVITVPQGTRLMVRTSEVLDSRQHPAGHRFRGQLGRPDRRGRGGRRLDSHQRKQYPHPGGHAG